MQVEVLPERVQQVESIAHPVPPLVVAATTQVKWWAVHCLLLPRDHVHVREGTSPRTRVAREKKGMPLC